MRVLPGGPAARRPGGMEPCPSPFNLARHVLQAGLAAPDKIALAEPGPPRETRWRYARLTRAVRGMAGGFRAAGLRPGDRLLLRLGNTADFPIAFLGAIAADIVPVPTAEGLTAPEIDGLAHTVAPAAVLAHPGMTLPARAPRLVLRDPEGLMAHPPAEFAMGDPDRLAYLIFTSGSSGSPKAVAHAHRAIWARRTMWDGWYGLGRTDRVLHAGAFNWTYTLGTGLLDPWTIGATALIPRPGTTPDRLPALLKRHEATIFAAVPGIYRKLLSEGGPIALPRLRHGLSAGEKLPDTLRDAWRKATGTDIHEALGMSECSTFISGAPGRPAPAGTVGWPQPGRRIGVFTSAGPPAAPGDVGVLGIHGDDPGLCLGYATSEGGIERPWSGDWFPTGDLVAIGEDGAVAYHGRCDDLLTAGGYRISPLEIEAVFQGADGVDECAAAAVEVKADTRVLALVFAGTASGDDLRPLAEASLARYKRPRLYLRRETLPRSANGKLDRRALGAALEEGGW